MLVLHNGEVWKIRMDNELRRVKVLAAAGIPGWWRCIDLGTDIYVLARESCFVERERPIQRTGYGGRNAHFDSQGRRAHPYRQ
jgi:hypothetical protein